MFRNFANVSKLFKYTSIIISETYHNDYKVTINEFLFIYQWRVFHNCLLLFSETNQAISSKPNHLNSDNANY